MKKGKNRTDNKKKNNVLIGILICTVLFTAVGCGNSGKTGTATSTTSNLSQTNSVSQTEQSSQSTTENKEDAKKPGLMDTIDYNSILTVNYDSDGSLMSAQLKKYYRKGVVKELYSVVKGEKVEDLYTKNPEITYSEPNEQTRTSVDNTNYEKITYDSNWNVIKYESGGNSITYSYDQNGNLIVKDNKFTGLTTSNGYSYDENNLCISSTTETKEITKKYDIKYDFDTNGYPTRRITYYDGKEESYEIFTRNEEHQIIQIDSYRAGKLAVTEKYE